MRISHEYFQELSQALMGARKAREHLIVSLSGEASQFLRFSNSRVRQFGEVEDATLKLTFIAEAADGLHKVARNLTLTGDSGRDKDRAFTVLAALRGEAAEIPADPFAWLPEEGPSSRFEEGVGQPMFDPASLVEQLLPASRQGLDLVGLVAQGPVVRAVSSSAGVDHWYQAPSFFCEYSLYPSVGALKASKRALGGKGWDASAFEKDLEHAVREAQDLDKQPVRLGRGEYRAYLAPDAVADLVQMLSWNGLGETSIQQGESPLKWMREGSRKLSPLFTLEENFEDGLTPRFNSNGDLAPSRLPLIEAGLLRNSLVSARCAREHGLKQNGADDAEKQRSPSLRPGSLAENEILEVLGTGLYLSNIHYLNWSDQQEGRITGMTRHACFWVENGRRVAPIETMRWDDCLYRIFGSELEALGDRQEFIPETRTYEERGVGGLRVPGALLKGLRFTL